MKNKRTIFTAIIGVILVILIGFLPNINPSQDGQREVATETSQEVSQSTQEESEKNEDEETDEDQKSEEEEDKAKESEEESRSQEEKEQKSSEAKKKQEQKQEEQKQQEQKQQEQKKREQEQQSQAQSRSQQQASQSQPASSQAPEPTPPPVQQTVTVSVSGVLGGVQVPYSQGDTAMSVTQKALSSAGIPMSVRGGYVEGINGLFEFDRGPFSGWKYTVNGSYPGVGAGATSIQPGSSVNWVYVTDYR